MIGDKVEKTVHEPLEMVVSSTYSATWPRVWCMMIAYGGVGVAHFL